MPPYNTGNPIGSTDARDLSDNAQNLDQAVNSSGSVWTDRLGNVRPTWNAVAQYAGPAYDASTYGGLEAALTALGAGPATLQYGTGQTFTQNRVIPAGIELLPLNGAVINHGAYTISYAGSTARWDSSRKFNGTGAVTLARAKEVLPQWFDTIGISAARDTAAIKAAIATGRNVYAPWAYYHVNASLHPKNNQRIRGDSGAGMFPSTDNVTVFKMADGANCDLFVADVGVKYVHLLDLYMEGNSANQTGGSRGVYIVADVTPGGEECQWDIENSTVSDFNGDGIYVGNLRRAARISDCHIMQNKGNGVSLNASDCTVEDSAIGLNTLDGVYVNNWVASIRGNGIFWNRNGININSIGNMAQVVNNGIDRNYSHGIFSYGSNGTFVGNVFHSNSQTLTGDKNDMNFDGTFGGAGNVVDANTFDTDEGSAFNAGYNIAVFNGAKVKLGPNSATDESHTIDFTNDMSLTGLVVAEGINQRMGLAALTAGTALVLNNSVSTSTRVMLTVQTPSGAQGHLSVVKTAGESFRINSTSGTESSLVAWLLIEPEA